METAINNSGVFLERFLKNNLDLCKKGVPVSMNQFLAFTTVEGYPRSISTVGRHYHLQRKAQQNVNIALAMYGGAYYTVPQFL